MAKVSLRGREEWLNEYLKGIEAGAQKYISKKDTMVNNYGQWVDFITPTIQSIAPTLPEKGPDPVANWLRRGAPYVRAFVRAGKEFESKKVKMVRPVPVTV
jgi:hypothetical protein